MMILQQCPLDSLCSSVRLLGLASTCFLFLLPSRQQVKDTALPFLTTRIMPHSFLCDKRGATTHETRLTWFMKHRSHVWFIFLKPEPSPRQIFLGKRELQNQRRKHPKQHPLTCCRWRPLLVASIVPDIIIISATVVLFFFFFFLLACLLAPSPLHHAIKSQHKKGEHEQWK